MVELPQAYWHAKFRTGIKLSGGFANKLSKTNPQCLSNPKQQTLQCRAYRHRPKFQRHAMQTTLSPDASIGNKRSTQQKKLQQILMGQHLPCWCVPRTTERPRNTKIKSMFVFNYATALEKPNNF